MNHLDHIAIFLKIEKNTLIICIKNKKIKNKIKAKSSNQSSCFENQYF